MAWTTPATVIAGQLMTAAFWNTQVRDNKRFLREQPWPIGCVFHAGVSTNPATLLGFGTWAPHGPGRLEVGLDAAQAEFDTLDETGGAKTHALTVAELAAHPHDYNPAQWTINTFMFAFGSPPEAGNFSSPLADTGNAGGGAAHNNLMPYLVVYRWKRLA